MDSSSTDCSRIPPRVKERERELQHRHALPTERQIHSIQHVPSTLKTGEINSDLQCKLEVLERRTWGGESAGAMLSTRDDVASPTHLRWQAERVALTAEAQAELAALHTERLQVAAGHVAAAAVDTVTQAVASDAAHAISWAGRRWSAGALSADSVAVATLQVELSLVERDASQAAGAVVRAASFVAELVAREDEPATLLAAAVCQ